MVGPAAVLDERPEPTRKRFFWSPPGLVLIAVALVVLVISLFDLGGTLWEGDAADRVATLAGAGVGALVGVGAVLGVFWLFAKLRNR